MSKSKLNNGLKDKPAPKLRSLSAEIDLGSTAFYKLVGLGLGVFANFGAVAILTRQFGIVEYASYALIASLLFLLPFADLGIGAGVINVISDLRSGRVTYDVARMVLARSTLVLTGVGITLACASLLLWRTGEWATILGSLGTFQPAVSATAFTVVAIAIGLPFGLGARMLQGEGKVRLNVQLGLISPMMTAALLAVLFITGSPVDLFFLIPGTAYVTVTVFTYVVARHTSAVGKLSLTAACRKKATNNYPLMRAAIPFFIVSIGTALGLQSHRIILAHASDAASVAAYSFVAQFAGPLSAVIITTGQNLWSKYRNSSQIRDGRSEFAGHLRIFIGLGASAAVILVSTVPLASLALTNRQLDIPISLLGAAALYIMIVAAHQPGSMYLTDTRGLYGQAFMVVGMSASSIIVMLYLVPRYGESMTYLASALALLIFQLVPSWLVITRRLQGPTIRKA